MLDFEIHQQITAIAESFQLYECIECATAIKEFLVSQNKTGKMISINTGSTKKPFSNIYHDRLQQNISTNGRHMAILVEIKNKELIFDNIHPKGVSRLD